MKLDLTFKMLNRLVKTLQIERLPLERPFIPRLLVGAEDDASPVLGKKTRRDRPGVTIPRSVYLKRPLNNASSIDVLAAEYQGIPVTGESKSKY